MHLLLETIENLKHQVPATLTLLFVDIVGDSAGNYQSLTFHPLCGVGVGYRSFIKYGTNQRTGLSGSFEHLPDSSSRLPRNLIERWGG